MTISDVNARALRIFPPSILTEPYLDFFDFLSRHDEDYENESLIEEKVLIRDFYKHCIEHEPKKPHLKNQKPFLKKSAIELLKKLHDAGFLLYGNDFVQGIKWDSVRDFNYLLNHIARSNERKVKWALYYFVSNRKGKTKFDFKDLEELVKDLNISNLKKIVSKITKTQQKAISAHMEVLMDPDIPLKKSHLRTFVDDIEWTSRRSPGELDEKILELLDQGSYSNKELVQILDTNKALISKSMTRLYDDNEIILYSQGSRGSHYYTTNCDNCPFGKEEFSCRREAEKSIRNLIKSNFDVDISDKDFESVTTNQAMLKLESELTQILKEQNTKMEKNINENLLLIFEKILDTHAMRKITSRKSDELYFSLNTLMEKMPILFHIGLHIGNKMGASLFGTLVNKVLLEKVSKKELVKLQKEFVKEFNKMASTLQK